ncbi:MAG: hypothetical protein LH649_18095 [Pseudanabaena sp. CAN_BIN31]|nr:hypothetical protein [Pseudanabaena sp. CAN_BIN31]
MGFEEIFVFVVVGCVASYRQRSHQNNQTQIFILWILAVVLPSLAIAWTSLNRTALPLIFVTIVFLFCVWIYGNLPSFSNANVEIIELDSSEEKQLKDCFPSAIYQLKDLDYHPQEIYCRGNLRSHNPKYAYDTISQNIQKIFGDRFVCHLQESPLKNLGTGFSGAENIQENKTNYCFCLICSSDRAEPRKYHQNWIASTISIIFTTFTVLAVGANIYRLEDLTLINLQKGIPYFLGIASIFSAKAIAQYFIAKKYQLQLAPPLLLPFLGGFGLLSSLNTSSTLGQNPKNQRRILFDLVAISTIAGLVISVILLILGNWLLVPASPAIADPAMATSLSMPNLNSFDFKNSILATFIHAICTLGKSGITSINTSEIITIPAFSPLTLAGWSGLALSALQLMPFDLLDGGNLAIAMFGHRQAVKIARIARLVLLTIALLVQPWLKIYSLLLFLLPIPHPLILNESIEIDRTRDLIGIALMTIALLIILPMPKSFVF